MTVTAKTLIESVLLSNAQTTLYTATNCKALVDKCTIVNTSASNVTISINVVVSGGSASSANYVIKDKSIAPNETYNCPEMIGQSLMTGDFISTIAGTNVVLSLRVSGREIT